MSHPAQLEHITFHTTTARNLYHERVGQKRSAEHNFQQVVGIEFADRQIGADGRDTFEIDVPLDWGQRLREFMPHIERSPNQDGPRLPRVNCHYFATFMSTDKPSGKSPHADLEKHGEPLPVGYAPAFNEHLVLARFPGGEPTAIHSAISLGPQAPEKVIQVTAYDGVLAIDSISKVLFQYKHKAFYIPEWYRLTGQRDTPITLP